MLQEQERARRPIGGEEASGRMKLDRSIDRNE